MSLTHQFVQDYLHSQRRLTPTEQAEVAEHLAICQECQAYAMLHQTLIKTLADPNPPLRHSDWEIRQKAAAVRTAVEKRRFPGRMFHNSLSLAGAAAVVILIFAILALSPRMMPGHPAPLSQATRGTTGVPAVTASATVTSASQPAAPALPFLSSFPIDPGTTWVYTKTGYAQAEGDPQKIIQGTTKIEERIASVQAAPPYTLVHIQGRKSLVSANSGWQETGTFGLGDYEYWYVIKDNQVYLSYQRPDAASIDLSKMLLSYQFPMAVGSEWCLNSQRGSVEGTMPAPAAPCESRRVVISVRSLTSPSGQVKPCYEIHDVANSGDVVSQFCEGIGIVSIKYHHSGSQFGYDQSLSSYKHGKDGVLQTDFTTAQPASNTSDVVRIPAPDRHSTIIYQKKLGQLSVEDSQGKQTSIAVNGQDRYLIPGSWSPDSRYLLFWQGVDSASIQADGLPLWSLEVSTGKTFQLSKAVLVNPAYVSWASDGHALVFTNGGYRSAQFGKWLSLYTPADRQVIDLIPQEKLVPGQVAWSPGGKTIAFAAVDAARTGPQFADLMDWSNPAILERRLYRLDPSNGQYQRLNTTDAYQDAPRWDQAGRLYFVQLDQEQAHIMRVRDLMTGAADPLPLCQAARLTPVGYYGQVDWSFLFNACPATTAGMLTSLPSRVAPAVAVQGQTAYLGLGSRLAAIDISRPDAPQLAAQSAELPGPVIKVIALRDGASLRIAASAGRYLAEFDAATPGDLSLITQSKLPGPISALIVDLSSGDIYTGGALEADASMGFVARLSTSAPDTLQLLGTVQLPAPVQSLAMANSVLYAALKGDSSGVMAVPMRGDQFAAPKEVIAGVTVVSMTTTGNVLYIGGVGQMLAYNLLSPDQPRLAWQITQANGATIPGSIYGFEIRPSTIFIAGLDSMGQSFHQMLTPSEPLKTGSMVDTASCVAVTAGQMVIAGSQLEIYDSRDPQALKLLGTYLLTTP